MLRPKGDRNQQIWRSLRSEIKSEKTQTLKPREQAVLGAEAQRWRSRNRGG